MSRVALLAALLLLFACSTGAPGAPTTSPTEVAPSPTAVPATAAPTPTEAMASPTPTAAPTTSEPTPTTGGQPYVDPNDDPYDYGPPETAAPPPAGDSLVVETAESDELGTYLVGPDGLALYTFTQDSGGSSSCTGSCADAWPPLVIEEGASVEPGDGVDGTFATTPRGDGSTQVTYDGAPLYYYAGDSAPMDTNGHGIGEVWFLATP